MNLPPLPSRVWTCHGQRLSPWLVKFARSDGEIVTWTFTFLLQKRTGWIFCLPVFIVNWYFSTLIAVCFQHVWCFPISTAIAIPEGGYLWRRIWATTRIVFTDWKIHRLSFAETPVSDDHRVGRRKECPSSSPYFWPVVRMHPDLCRVLYVFRLIACPCHGGQESHCLAYQTNCGWRLDNNW